MAILLDGTLDYLVYLQTLRITIAPLPAPPLTHYASGGRYFSFKEEFGQNEKTFIVAVLGLCHTPGHPSHRCPCS